MSLKRSSPLLALSPDRPRPSGGAANAYLPRPHVKLTEVAMSKPLNQSVDTSRVMGVVNNRAAQKLTV